MCWIGLSAKCAHMLDYERMLCWMGDSTPEFSGDEVPCVHLLGLNEGSTSTLLCPTLHACDHLLPCLALAVFLLVVRSLSTLRSCDRTRMFACMSRRIFPPPGVQAIWHSCSAHVTIIKQGHEGISKISSLSLAVSRRTQVHSQLPS